MAADTCSSEIRIGAGGLKTIHLGICQSINTRCTAEVSEPPRPRSHFGHDRLASGLLEAGLHDQLLVDHVVLRHEDAQGGGYLPVHHWLRKARRCARGVSRVANSSLKLETGGRAWSGSCATRTSPPGYSAFAAALASSEPPVWPKAADRSGFDPRASARRGPAFGSRGSPAGKGFPRLPRRATSRAKECSIPRSPLSSAKGEKLPQRITAARMAIRHQDAQTAQCARAGPRLGGQIRQPQLKPESAAFAGSLSTPISPPSAPPNASRSQPRPVPPYFLALERPPAKTIERAVTALQREFPIPVS